VSSGEIEHRRRKAALCRVPVHGFRIVAQIHYVDSLPSSGLPTS
jgi:hypothetical protein